MQAKLVTEDAQQRFRSGLSRQILVVSVVVTLAAAVMFLVVPGRLGWPERATMAFGDLALAMSCAALYRSGSPVQLTNALPLIIQVGIVLSGVGAWVTAEGLYSPGLSFLPVLVCLLAVVGGVRQGLPAALTASVILILYALAVWLGWWQPDVHAAYLPVQRQLLTHLLAVGVALAGGGLLSAALDRTLASGEERQRRFSGLLAIAADAYWELDDHGRLIRLSAKDELRTFFGLSGRQAEGLGLAFWETRGVDFDAQVLDTFRSELAARLPMRDVPMRWRDAQGRTRHFMLSAEPRANELGKFAGYWGVLRDVTQDVKARQALWSTETRYQDLFRRIPTPLILHREGRVLDANPAGVALYGQPDLRALLGTDLLVPFEAGLVRERARARLQRLEELGVGEGLPEEEFILVPPHGRRLMVRLSSVRVDVDGEAASLSIFTDETGRRAAEELVRRSEALLSHLVATSPDAIVLNELPSGRYTMVNPTFLAITGHRAENVVGRTALELGVWPDPQKRAEFMAMMDRDRTVQNVPAQLLSKDGRLLSVLLSSARFTIDGTDYQMTSARDITAAEQARREHEAILDNALIGIAFTRDATFQMTNRRFDEMFGWTRGALIGLRGHTVWPTQQAWEDFGRLVGPSLARGEQVDTECLMKHQDGGTFTCRLLARALDPSQPGRGGTIWLAEDITERRAVAQALARARDEAEAANRAKSAFLANTSHEIRTPLNALLGLAQLARTPDIDDARRLQYLEQICDSAETLTAIISDILDLSKIEAGRLAVEEVPFDLHGLVRLLGEAYGAIADARGLQLHVAVDEDVPPLVLGDPVRLRQILANYLTNALKFTTRGHLGLSVHRGVGHRIRFEVLDTGEGMAAESLPLLFQPFSQVDNSITRKVGGTGLGLSICRELAQLMGGEVGVESEPGQGSLFWAEIPLQAASDDEAAHTVISSSGAALLQGLRVLLVEDNPVNMMIAVALLERWGAVVDQAGDGEAALAAVQDAANEGNPFDVVLMDVQMPGMSGHEVTRRLRRRWSRRQLPVIALTAAALVSEREDAMAAGMNDFLTKPIDANRLYASLHRVMIGDSARDD